MNYEPPMSKYRKPLHEMLPLKQPLSLFIDPSSHCNFHCNFCYHSQVECAGSVMKMELFDKIVDDMQQFDNPFKMIHLACFGEPLVNRNIVEFVAKLKNTGVAEKVQITTNGSLLTQELAQSLSEAGIDRILFSIYGLSNEMYRRFSAHNEKKDYFDIIYQNIAYLHSLKDRCLIHCKIAGDFFSEGEKQTFLNKFGAISDTIFIDNAIEQWPGLKVDHIGKSSVYGGRISPKICPMPFYQLVIHPDGLVSPCPVDWDRRVIVGDISKISLHDIWNGEKYRSMRRRILTGLPGMEYCQCCEYPSCGSTVDITPYREVLKDRY